MSPTIFFTAFEFVRSYRPGVISKSLLIRDSEAILAGCGNGLSHEADTTRHDSQLQKCLLH